MKSKENKGPKSSKAKGDRAKDIRKAQERNSQERARELASAISGVKQKRVNKRSARVGRHLAGLFSFIPHKSDNDWVPHSFNETRQKIEYFKTFVFKHYVPSSLILEASSNNNTATLCKSFLSLAVSGGSFYKQTKDIFTKKEAHHFLSSKADGLYNLFFEAKVKARDINPALSRIIIDAFTTKFTGYMQYANIENFGTSDLMKMVIEFLDFIARNQDYAWTKNEIEDICDFVRNNAGRHRAPNGGPTPYDRFADFSFAGRTVGSVSRLVNEWHQVLNAERPAVRPGRPSYNSPPCPSSWNGYNVENLDTQVKDRDNVVYNYRITQLLSSNELYHEGQNMHHCVGSYTRDAAFGRCAIFSVTRVMKGKGKDAGKVENVATIELVHSGGGNYRIAQMRAKCNKDVDSLTKTVIERWKREKA